MPKGSQVVGGIEDQKPPCRLVVVYGLQRCVIHVIRQMNRQDRVVKRSVQRYLRVDGAPVCIHDKIIGVGGKVLPIRDDMISRYYSYYKILEPPSSLDYLVSANCCYFRDEVLDVGGFEEDIRKPGGEDVGLSFKLARKGWRFDKAEDAIIFHDYRSSVRDLGRTFWNYGQGCRRVTARYLVESEADLGTKSAPRGGYGYGPLSPAKITPGILTRDTLAEFRSLQAERSGSEVVAFSTLRLVQRLAYYYGWKAG